MHCRNQYYGKPITRRSITDIRCTGKTARRSPRPHDTGIMDEVKKVTDYNTVKTMTLEDAKAAGLYETIGANIDDPYIEELKKTVVHQDAIDAVGKELKIVYTPLHGTGNIPVRRILKELGFENVYVVPEQELPDGDFPTVSYPNPEAEEAFALGLELGKKIDADLILADGSGCGQTGRVCKGFKDRRVSFPDRKYVRLPDRRLYHWPEERERRTSGGRSVYKIHRVHEYGGRDCEILWYPVN